MKANSLVVIAAVFFSTWICASPVEDHNNDSFNYQNENAKRTCNGNHDCTIKYRRLGSGYATCDADQCRRDEYCHRQNPSGNYNCARCECPSPARKCYPNQQDGCWTERIGQGDRNRLPYATFMKWKMQYSGLPGMGSMGLPVKQYYRCHCNQ